MAPKNKGGLAINYTKLLYKALCAKILWNITTREEAWWKDVFARKCTLSNKSVIIDQKFKNGSCTVVWSLCKASIEITQIQDSWMSRNGQRIRIWEDHILGRVELSNNSTLIRLQNWMENNLHTLDDITEWDVKGRWNMEWLEIL